MVRQEHDRRPVVEPPLPQPPDEPPELPVAVGDRPVVLAHDAVEVERHHVVGRLGGATAPARGRAETAGRRGAAAGRACARPSCARRGTWAGRGARRRTRAPRPRPARPAGARAEHANWSKPWSKCMFFARTSGFTTTAPVAYPRLAQPLRERDERGVERGVELHAPVVARQERREERGHGGLRPRRGGDRLVEHDRVLREARELGRGVAGVAVERQVIGAQRVDEVDDDQRRPGVACRRDGGRAPERAVRLVRSLEAARLQDDLDAAPGVLGQVRLERNPAGGRPSGSPGPRAARARSSRARGGARSRRTRRRSRRGSGPGCPRRGRGARPRARR